MLVLMVHAGSCNICGVFALTISCTRLQSPMRVAFRAFTSFDDDDVMTFSCLLAISLDRQTSMAITRFSCRTCDSFRRIASSAIPMTIRSHSIESSSVPYWQVRISRHSSDRKISNDSLTSCRSRLNIYRSYVTLILPKQ